MYILSLILCICCVIGFAIGAIGTNIKPAKICFMLCSILWAVNVGLNIAKII